MQCGQCGGTAEGEINNNVKNSLCTSTKSAVSDKFWLCITRISVQTCTQYFQQTRTNGRASIRGSPTIRTVLAALWWRRWLSCGGIKQNAWTDYCLQKWPIDPFGSVLWNILWCSTFCIRSNSPISILFLFNSTIKNYTSISLNTHGWSCISLSILSCTHICVW